MRSTLLSTLALGGSRTEHIQVDKIQGEKGLVLGQPAWVPVPFLMAALKETPRTGPRFTPLRISTFAIVGLPIRSVRTIHRRFEHSDGAGGYHVADILRRACGVLGGTGPVEKSNSEWTGSLLCLFFLVFLFRTILKFGGLNVDTC